MVYFAIGCAWLAVATVGGLVIGKMLQEGDDYDLQYHVDWLLEENVKLRDHIARADSRAQLAQAAATELRRMVLEGANLPGERDGD